MATEEIPEMDTLLEEDVEDVGELELEDEGYEEEVLEEPVASRAPVRRAAAAAVEPETEGMGLRVAMIATSLVLVLAVPISISVSSGSPGDLAKTIAGIFGYEF